jgi:hypothetical protein
MYLSRQMTERSFPEVGEFFHRHHTTVVHAAQTVPERFSNVRELSAVLAIAAAATALCRERCERDQETALALRLAILSPDSDLPSSPEPAPPAPAPKPLPAVLPHPPRRLLVAASSPYGQRGQSFRAPPEKLRAERA